MKILSAIFAAVWLLIIIALHFLHSEYSPANHTVSEYATMKRGWLLRLACFSMALSQGLAAVAQKGLNRITALFAALSFLFIIMGIFNTDPVVLTQTERRTVRGSIHIVAAMLSILLFNAMAVEANLKTSKPILWIIGAILPVSTLMFFAATLAAMCSKKAAFGYMQRINLTIVTLWQIAFVLIS
jgi:hypothetical protein